MTVYIPTVGRPEQVRDCIIPAWLDQELLMVIVTVKQEEGIYRNMIKTAGWETVKVVSQPPGVKGIGAAKRYIVERAAKAGLKSIIIAEDDAVPDHDSDFPLLLEEAKSPSVLGIGAARAIYDFYTGGALRANRGTAHPLIIYPGAAFVLYSLNIRNALAAGNYDEALHTCQDDAELPRQGIAKLGIPWMVHCDIWWHSLNKRYAPGGVNAVHRNLAARQAAEDECRAIVHARWPKYMSPPGKRERMQWKRMLDDYIPDWRSRSAMHGGRL